MRGLCGASMMACHAQHGTAWCFLVDAAGARERATEHTTRCDRPFAALPYADDTQC